MEQQTTNSDKDIEKTDKESENMENIVSSSTSSVESKETKSKAESSVDTSKETEETIAQSTDQEPSESTDKDDSIKSHNSPSSSSSSGIGGDKSVELSGPTVCFKAIYNGKKYDMDMSLNSTVLELKEALSPIIGVMPSMQKIMIKGLAADDKTLSDLGVNRMSKVLVVGSKLDDVVNVNLGKPAGTSGTDATSGSSNSSKKETLCSQKNHKKILDKGVPDDAHPGIKNTKELLPRVPLSGMVNKLGDKLRLTFKLELDQIWIGTKQRTEKVNMSSIRSIVSEAIPGHEQYHLMGLQLGTTEASRYWIYWVPCQYVAAIKSCVLGTIW